MEIIMSRKKGALKEIPLGCKRLQLNIARRVNPLGEISCVLNHYKVQDKIVLELIKEEQTASQLASKYQVTAKTISNWKKQFIENMAIAFEPAKAVSEFV